MSTPKRPVCFATSNHDARQGRPTTKKGLATRERIVAAASELMIDQGVAGTTIENVMQRADVSTSQIYHYFGDKSGLVAAVINYQTAAIVGQQEPMFLEFDTIEVCGVGVTSSSITSGGSTTAAAAHSGRSPAKSRKSSGKPRASGSRIRALGESHPRRTGKHA